MFCAQPLLQTNFRDVVKDHCHINGKYRGAAHNACNLKLRIKPKTVKIPVVFHNLKGYDAHLLMQELSSVKREIRCVANNMEKYVTFSVGGVSFIDSYNFLLQSLDKVVEATPLKELKRAKNKARELLKEEKTAKEKLNKEIRLIYMLRKKGYTPTST